MTAVCAEFALRTKLRSRLEAGAQSVRSREGRKCIEAERPCECYLCNLVRNASLCVLVESFHRRPVTDMKAAETDSRTSERGARSGPLSCSTVFIFIYTTSQGEEAVPNPPW